MLHLIHRCLILMIMLCCYSFFGLTQNRPNLVFVFADQLRANMFGYTGNYITITPNIDKFASKAVTFTNAVSVSPVCSPYLSSLLTDKYISSTGMVINDLNMNLNDKTIVHILNDAGYNCGYVGKMHLNDGHKRNYQIVESDDTSPIEFGAFYDELGYEFVGEWMR